jgi:hypothetical protein
MRLLGLTATAVVFLMPLAVFAQHVTAPAPVPAPAAPVHFSPPSPITSAPSATAHSAAVSSAPSGMTMPRSGTQGPRSPEIKHELNIAHADQPTLSQSRADKLAQYPGFFSFLHKRPNKCEHGACQVTPSPETASVRPASPTGPVAFARPVSCMTVPVFSMAVPCNVYAPCCP